MGGRGRSHDSGVHCRKFDIGVYTAITSIDPLRVYTYQEEILLRSLSLSLSLSH